MQLNVLGEHNVSNALAAAAAAHAVGLSLSGIAAGLNAVQPVKGRTVAQIAPNGVRVIDDSYNANPTSMCAAIDILRAFPGRTVLVLGILVNLASGRKKVTVRWASTRMARSMPCTQWVPT